MSEELRRALYASSVGSLDLDLFIPDLVGVTEILTEDHRRQVSQKQCVTEGESGDGWENGKFKRNSCQFGQCRLQIKKFAMLT